MKQMVQVLVGAIGLVVFVVTTIISISMMNNNDDKNIVAAQPTCNQIDDDLFNPCAELDDSLFDDLRIHDELIVDLYDAPRPLVEALLEIGVYETSSVNGNHLVIQVGTYVVSEDAMYLATGEGWLGCQDYVTWDAECDEDLMVPITTVTV